jgi:hypothetical protein
MWTNEPRTTALRRPWRSSFPTCRGPHTSPPFPQRSSGRSRGPTQLEPGQMESARRRALQWGRRGPPAPWLRPWLLRGRGSARLVLCRWPLSLLQCWLPEGPPGRRRRRRSQPPCGVHRPQAVCSDGEGAGISRLYLSQLGPQGLREALHEV